MNDWSKHRLGVWEVTGMRTSDYVCGGACVQTAALCPARQWQLIYLAYHEPFAQSIIIVHEGSKPLPLPIHIHIKA